MARSVIRLEGDEISCFHANYLYMWKKLNTAPYYVNGSGELPPWIREEYLLPSYVNLSHCMNPDYVPSMNLVNKIVQFYNANISPAVDTYIFLHERLEEGDAHRTTVGGASAAPYCGTYFCYYFSEAEDGQFIRGALLYLFEKEGELRANLIAEILENEMLSDPSLKKMLQRADLSETAFSEYKKRLSLSRKRIIYLRGAGKLTPGLIHLQLQCPDREGLYASVFMPLKNADDGRYIGNLGILAERTPDHGMQFYRIGIERADHPELKMLSLQDEKLKELLALHKGKNQRVTLSQSENTAWMNYMILH